MWEFLFISSVAIQVICGQLIGDHICLINESYTVNVTEPYLRNITIRKYEWCMNIPPRCSHYSTREINDTKIAEKTYVNTVQKCCPGFYENNNKCLPYCEKCENGLCDIDLCICPPGFGGGNCDSRCDPGSWGSNCTNTCNCGGKICNPFTGNCTIEILEISDEIEEEVVEKININQNTSTIVKSNTSEINYNTIPLNISKEHFLDHETKNNETERTNITNISILKEIPILPPFVEIQNQSTSIPDMDIPDESLFSAIDAPEILKTSPKTMLEENRKYKEGHDFLINERREFLIPVKIKYDKIARPLTKNDITITTDSGLFNDADNNRALLPESNNIVNNVSISTATTTVIIILVIIIVTIHHIKRNKRKSKENMETQTSVGVSTVSVYTTSIFHTPLPDLPAYKNPSYLTPTEYHINELKSFGTPVVCNMNKQNSFNPDCKDYIYDHPPSTGSYRAASVVDPLDVDVNMQNIVPTIIQTEPVYDEIPCQGFQQVGDTSFYSHPKSLYMNTGGST